MEPITYIIIAIIILLFSYNIDPIMDYFDDLDENTRKGICLLLLVLIIAFVIHKYNNSQIERFDVKMEADIDYYVDLEDFFQFVEYIQKETMDPYDTVHHKVLGRDDEYAQITNNAKNLMNILAYLDKNKYYQMYVSKNKCQAKTGETIDLNDHYRHEIIQVNLSALKSLFEISERQIQEIDPDKDKVTNELVLPIKTIKGLITEMTNTRTYREYVHSQKFKLKYAGLVFNPNMIRI